MTNPRLTIPKTQIKKQFVKALSAAALICITIIGIGSVDQQTKADTNQNGLNATYFADQNLGQAKLTRIDNNIDFNWKNGSPDPSIPSDHFSVRWEGLIQPRYSEYYTFSTYTDDGVRLWINNQLVIDNWNDHPGTVNTGIISLAANQQYPIKMEFYEDTGKAAAKLSWVSASQQFETVPQSQLFATTQTQTAVLTSTQTTSTTQTSQTSTVSTGLTAGVANSVNVNVTNPVSSVSNAIVDIEFFDSGNQRVFQQFFQVQSLSSGQTANYTVSWTPSVAGTYKEKYGLFSSDWSTLYFWQDNAGSLTVESPSTSTAPSTTTTSTVTTTSTNNSNNPFAGAKLYWNPNNDAHVWADAHRASDPANAALMDKIGNQAEVEWLGGWNSNITNDVSNFMNNITSAGALPVFVVYNIPNRDCGGYSAGGIQNPSDYQTWIDQIASSIGNRKAVMILEPDGLSLIDCLSSQDLATRYSLLKYAVSKFSSNGQTVYLDAGHPNWISASDMANRLKQAGVDQANGFALNIANFFTNSDNATYGKQISDLIGGKHFVVDTGRNGLGPTPDNQWCNPPGRALGNPPTTNTGNGLIDAYLWVKGPGGSDGQCNGGPSAGTFWPQYALDLASRTSW